MNRIILIVLFITASFTQQVFARELYCQIHHELHHGSTLLDATYKLSMNKSDIGALTLYGKYTDNGVMKIINRQILFNYVENKKDSYLFKSDKITRYSSETISDAEMATHYPSFFTASGEKMDITIQPFSRGRLIISFMATPLFICS